MNDTTIEPLTNEEIETIRARVDGATPGPWTAERGQDDGPRGDRIGCVRTEDGAAITGWGSVQQRGTDAEFIAAARTDIPRLIATIDARDKTIAERDAEIARLRARMVTMHCRRCHGSEVESTTDAPFERACSVCRPHG